MDYFITEKLILRDGGGEIPVKFQPFSFVQIQFDRIFRQFASHFIKLKKLSACKVSFDDGFDVRRIEKEKIDKWK